MEDKLFSKMFFFSKMFYEWIPEKWNKIKTKIILILIEENNVPELKQDVNSKVKQLIECWPKIIERKKTIETCE